MKKETELVGAEKGGKISALIRERNSLREQVLAWRNKLLDIQTSESMNKRLLGINNIFFIIREMSEYTDRWEREQNES